MNNKTKMIATGGVIAILLVLVVYFNFFSGTTPPALDPKAEQAIQKQIEENTANPPREPDMSKLPEEARKAGGKAAPRP